jgi:hypothetical protein
MAKNLEVMEIGSPKKRRMGTRTVAWATLVVAVSLFLVGTQLSRKVHAEVALRSKARAKAMETITEWQLVEDSTFSGVQRINGKLYSTYNRKAKKTKRACPT